MPSTRPDEESTHETYARLLLPKRDGYPLWVPEPTGLSNIPTLYREDGYQIGDVGVVNHSGGFRVFFNVCEDRGESLTIPADQSVPAIPSRWRGPGGFTPIILMTEHYEDSDYHTAPTIIGRSMTSKKSLVAPPAMDGSVLNLPAGFGLGYRFGFSSKEGALLVMPEGSRRRRLVNGFTSFCRLASEHAGAWYDFINGVGGGRLDASIKENALYLVTGWDKSKSWAGGAYRDYTQKGDFYAILKATPAFEGVVCMLMDGGIIVPRSLVLLRNILTVTSP
ncbi:hypothetical protein JAAARDRAFT_57909 [Jaapia argillacea MUCL 33604]|uniref:Uncharacterized protein n=1 Tax=Jaapia argillacea MUCL 33604 TaxID=933084 RepID=A0A067Q3U4_9AGAM|nr:hypothetical protein JAAARDRAFT_57909 [Jaapia argillacea MUCL 33604]